MKFSHLPLICFRIQFRSWVMSVLGNEKPLYSSTLHAAQKMKFSIKDFFSKCDQIRRKLLLKKSLLEIFIFCAVINVRNRKIFVDTLQPIFLHYFPKAEWQIIYISVSTMADVADKTKPNKLDGGTNNRRVENCSM